VAPHAIPWVGLALCSVFSIPARAERAGRAGRAELGIPLFWLESVWDVLRAVLLCSLLSLARRLEPGSSARLAALGARIAPLLLLRFARPTLVFGLSSLTVFLLSRSLLSHGLSLSRYSFPLGLTLLIHLILLDILTPASLAGSLPVPSRNPAHRSPRRFVTTPATSIFTRLPTPSTQASATSAVAAAIKHLHPVRTDYVPPRPPHTPRIPSVVSYCCPRRSFARAYASHRQASNCAVIGGDWRTDDLAQSQATHAATTADVDPETHEVLVDCAGQVRLCTIGQYEESTSPEVSDGTDGSVWSWCRALSLLPS
jgi:hypothetical protein